MIERDENVFMGIPRIRLEIYGELARSSHNGGIELDLALRMFDSPSSEVPVSLPITIFLVFTPRHHSAISQFVRFSCRTNPGMKRTIASYISRTPIGQERYFKTPEKSQSSMVGIWNFCSELFTNRARDRVDLIIIEASLNSYLWEIASQAPAAINFVVLGDIFEQRYNSTIASSTNNRRVPSVTSANINKYWTKFGFSRTQHSRKSTLCVFGNRYDVMRLGEVADKSYESARMSLANARTQDPNEPQNDEDNGYYD